MGSDLRSDELQGWPGPPGPVIAETVRAAASLRSPDSTLQALIGLMIETGPWTAGSICLLTPSGTMDTAAYLDARAGDCDRLQTEYGEGPAYDAVRGAAVQVGADLTAEPRWSRWSPAVSALGVRSALSARLFTTTTVGSVNLYSTRAVQLDDAAVGSARVIAAHASVVVAAMTTERHLRQALLSRTVIGQAQGILMERNGSTAEGALEFLRRSSQRRNIKLVALAQRIVETGIVPDDGVRG